MKETFYRKADGKIIFHAIESVGRDEVVSFAHTHGWSKNGFPNNEPEKLGPEIIWEAFEYTEKNTNTNLK